MSLAEGKQEFVDGMVTLQQKMLTKEVDLFQEYASDFADLVIRLVKKADVKAGILVATSGTATNQTGQTTTKGQLE